MLAVCLLRLRALRERGIPLACPEKEQLKFVIKSYHQTKARTASAGLSQRLRGRLWHQGGAVRCVVRPPSHRSAAFQPSENRAHQTRNREQACRRIQCNSLLIFKLISDAAACVKAKLLFKLCEE